MTVHVKLKTNRSQGEEILMSSDQFEQKAWGEQLGVDGRM